MIVIAGLIIGAFTGGLLAKRRKGNRLDILQYAVIYALMFGMLGLFVTLFIHRGAV